MEQSVTRRSRSFECRADSAQYHDQRQRVRVERALQQEVDEVVQADQQAQQMGTRRARTQTFPGEHVAGIDCGVILAASEQPAVRLVLDAAEPLRAARAV